MTEELLSVVIPVYNAKEYLEQAVQSVLDQTYHNLEIILVEDGSCDGSKEVCEKYAALDSRVKLILQNNQGAAAARRNGVSLASGSYITFLDADDYIDKDLYQQFMDCRANFDVVVSQWYRESGDHTRQAYNKLAAGAYQTPEDMRFLLRHLVNVSLPGGDTNIRSGIDTALWNKLFKTSVVREVFQSANQNLYMSVDVEIIYRFFLKCKSVLISNICGYHYRARRGSLGHSPDDRCRYLKNLCELYNTLEPIFAQDPYRDILLPQLNFKMSAMMTQAPDRMGFGPEAQLQIKPLIFPFMNLLKGRRIALYGAGAVGQSYKRQIQKWGACEIALWVDPDWKEHARAGLEVAPVETLGSETFDSIIIAAFHAEEAAQIRLDLLSLGIENAKILWRAPLEV